MNDRWRTVETVTADDTGAVELRVTLGEYVVTWEGPEGQREVRFTVEKGPGTLRVAVVGEATVESTYRGQASDRSVQRSRDAGLVVNPGEHWPGRALAFTDVLQ